MAKRLSFIAELSASTIKGFSGKVSNWTNFLKTASWNYKYPFHEQLLIYAQRPDATACAEIEVWNGKLKRWINKGAKGIALIRERQGQPYLVHVFDVSDTNSFYGNDIKLWEHNGQYEDEIIETLKNTFGDEKEYDNLINAVLSVSEIAAADNKVDYIKQLSTENSFLEGLDELNIDLEFQRLLKNSVAHMVLNRLGYEADEYFEDDDFRGIANFNTAQVMAVLGAATSDISEMALRSIAETIKENQRAEFQKRKKFARSTETVHNKNNEKNIVAERNDNHGTGLQDRGRLSDTRRGNTGGTADRQIRDAASDIHQTAPQTPIFTTDDGRQADRTPAGNRQHSTEPDGTALNEIGGRNSNARQSDRPNGMGRHDEQFETFSRGTGTYGTGLQLSLFPTEEEQKNIIKNAERSKRPAFSISQQVIDEVLCSGSNNKNSTLRICTQYSKRKTPQENIEFLKNEYQKSGKGFCIGENKVSVWFDIDGIRIAEGTSALDNSTLVTWPQAEKRIGELLELGRFMPQADIERAEYNELKELADKLWYLHQDLNYDIAAKFFIDDEVFQGGFPDSTERIAQMLKERQEVGKIIVGLSAFVEEYECNPSVLRYRFHKPKALLHDIGDLLVPRKVFVAEQSFKNQSVMFITQDELNDLLINGSGIEQGKFRIYSYFLQKHTAKEKQDFLKNEYGIGGHGVEGYNEWHDSKGITYSRGFMSMPYDKVTLLWSMVERQISKLIADGKYMSQRELDQIPAYEKEIIAIGIYHFYSDVPMGKPRPYPMGFNHYDAKPLIMEQLDSKEKSTELLLRMSEIMDEITPDDRHYSYKKKAFDDFTQYNNDTFSLFKRPAPKEAVKITQPKSEDASIRNYDLHFGDIVYIGTDEYTVVSLGKEIVQLNDPNFPLLMENMARNEFDRKLRENPMNDRLQTSLPPKRIEYQNIKTEFPNCIAINQVGDFYEFWGKDAENAAKILDISIMHTEVPGLADKQSMCGIPANTLENNIQKLLDNGHEVALRGTVESSGEIEIVHIVPATTNLPELFEQAQKILEKNDYVVSDELLDYAVETLAANNIKNPTAEQIAEQVELQLIADATDLDPDDYTVDDIFNEYSPLFISKVLYDEAYLNARKGFTDAQNAKVECDAAIKRAVLSIPLESNEALHRLFYDMPEFHNRLHEYVFKKTYTDFVKLNAKIDAIGNTKQKNTIEQRNYRLLKNLAPEIFSGESQYMRFTAGKAFMPLSIDVLGNNRIAVSHYKMRDGEHYADPDMEFVFDNEAETLTAKTFQQNGSIDLYQNTEANGQINRQLENKLNSFANQWFRNIKNQGYTKEIMTVLSNDEEIELVYDKDGGVISANGETEAIEKYLEEHNIVFKAPETVTFTQIEDIPKANEIDTFVPIETPNGISHTVISEQMADTPLMPSFNKNKATNKIVTYDIHPEIPLSDRYNFQIADDNLGVGGPKEKYRNNIEAIKTLFTIESENRFATPEEQEILSKYVGWGGLADVFDEDKPQWANEYLQLKSLLTLDEYTAARASTLNAHFTCPVVIKAMYKAVANMGFKKGNILEPSCGIGNFMGLLPQSMQDSKIYGIELDSITGRIAQQLYQKTSILIQGYENTPLPDSFFDVAIGNVPFGNYKILEKKYDKHNFLIHDFFFAKSLEKVRPGGVVAFITSSGTMDKKNPAVRKYIAQRADLLGAIRLPNNAFLANAGTQVTADILFLQKRDRLTDIEPDWVHLGTDENGYAINSYFVDNPQMILGEMTEESTQYGNDLTCRPYPDADLSEQLQEAITNIHAEITEFEFADIGDEEDLSIPADPNVRNFSYTVVDGDIYFRENSRMNKVEPSVTAVNRIKGMIEIRDCVRALIEYQSEDYSDETIKNEQIKLNALYDKFIQKYGLLNSRANNMVFSDDSSYCLLCSLEILDENGELARKADMFTKRTIRQHTSVQSVDTASEALAVSLNERAKVDIEFMCQLTEKNEEAIISDLEGVIFHIPVPQDEIDNMHFVTADEYLSGNVREKLKIAKLAAENNEMYRPNVKALEAVQPKDLSASEINVRLGATWIPPEIIQQFIFEFLGTSRFSQRDVSVRYSQYTGAWNVEGKSKDKGNVKAYSTYGTGRINAYRIIEESLNLRDVRIFDYVENEKGNRVPVLNKKETTIAQQKQEIIKSEFSEWIWKDPKRREMLTRLYNDKFNNVRPREYDGSHLTFSGINPEINLRPHQVNAIAHILYGGNTLLAHVVGAGKTFEMVAASMESKRLGLCNKSLFVVPNHLTEQWAAEFLQLYPSANILVATKKDFETKNRKKFCGRIATGDYDAIIIGHSQFEKIPMSAERQMWLLKDQISDISMGISELKENQGERYSIKQLEKTKRTLEAKLKKLYDQSRKDNVVTFEELGVDHLFIDEAHYYKNLFLYTKMRNVGGIAQIEAQKSSDLFMKCRYLDELTGGKGVIFATGTPISNSMVELYTLQRYLQYNTLVRNGLQHFDAWASTFGETITAIELAPEGTGYRAKTRFARFYNLPELMSMFKEIADIQTADMLNLPVPKANYKVISINPTELQKQMVKELSKRADDVRNKRVEPYEDNMLNITNDGRKLALDQRLINDMLPDDENSKVSACANDVFHYWQTYQDQRLTQLVFCDLSTPHYDGKFNVYDDLKSKLIAKGVPEDEVAFIHDADTEVKKKELFAKVRKGQVRVLIGSTPKMGAGTNVQDRLIALHDLDCPWRPSDLEQRGGRIVRQGNMNGEVFIIRYVTKNTFDAYLYQLVENKQKFISQIMTSKSPVRVAEDVDETALSYAEIKALATGNPHIKEKMDLDVEVAKLKLLKANYLNQKYELEDMIIKQYPIEIKLAEIRIAGYKADIELLKKHPKVTDSFSPMTIDEVTYSDKELAGHALIERFKQMASTEAVTIGTYRGFKMEMSFDPFAKITLRNELSYTVALGPDTFGNLTRLDNALEGLETKLKTAEETLENTKSQFETAKIEVTKPFIKEEELREKSARLDALNILLNMDKKENEIVDEALDEEDILPERQTKKEPAMVR